MTSLATTAITIRIASIGDGGWLDHVAPEVFDGTPTARRIDRYLAVPGHWLVLAFAGNEVIGKCSAMVHARPDRPDELYIDELDVTPRMRRMGVARMLLDRVIAMAQDWGCADCWVGTEIDNNPARKLYESMGARADSCILYELALN